MDSLTQRLAKAGDALSRLHEGVSREHLNDMERDGLIQRFEFCFEIMWKCGKDYLREHEGLDMASPKKVLRAFREIGLFSDGETELALKMVDDRNLTSHTYDEQFVIALVERIRDYEKFLQMWYAQMTAKRF
jgi:nucleotidyltransferase substrate binding protein (TIGR01987 family)